MNQPLSILASNAGRMASNHALACRLALRTSAACEAGLIESTADIASSSAKMAPALLRNRRACLADMVEMSADASTLMVTASAVSGGRSFEGGCPGIRTVPLSKPFQQVNERHHRGSYPLAIPGACIHGGSFATAHCGVAA